MPVRNNWCQRDSFYASTFSLVSTENEDGSWNVRPYQLTFPYRIDGQAQVLLSTRVNSRTHQNLVRNPKCFLNYCEYSEELIRDAAILGTPFLSHEYRDSHAGQQVDADGTLKNAFQVLHCTMVSATVTDRAVYAILDLNDIDFRRPDGFEPVMPITYGTHGTEFLFAQAPISARFDIRELMERETHE